MFDVTFLKLLHLLIKANMKKIALIIAMISLQSCISVRVNADVDSNSFYKKADNPSINAQGTFFENGVNDSKWSNSNGSNWTKAKFDDASVTSFVKFETTKKVSVNFHSNIKLEGNIRFEIIDESKNVLFSRDLTKDKEENFSVDFPNAGNYQIRWISKNATGSYFLEWKQD